MFSFRPSAVVGFRLALLSAVSLLLSVGLGGQAVAQPFTVTQEYFVPISSDNVRVFSQSINTNNLVEGGAPVNNDRIVHEVISLTALQNGTLVIIDHWEDGLEADIGNPGQIVNRNNTLTRADDTGTTEILGDGNWNNGAPPSCTTPGDDACDVVDQDAFIVLENDVLLPLVSGVPTRDNRPTPGDPLSPTNAISPIAYDGNDRIGVTEVIAVTRAGWRLQESTLLAGAVEVFPTYLWTTEIQVPVGQDLGINEGCTTTASNGAGPPPPGCEFEYVAVSITATQLGAAYEVDYDDDGTADSFGLLGPGASTLIPNAFIGTRITTTDPVQAHMVTGDVGSNYEGRWFNLVGTSQWANEYFSPVGTRDPVDEAHVILFNPNEGDITVDIETLGPGIGAPCDFETDCPTATPLPLVVNDGAGTTFTVTFTVTGVGTVGDVNLGLLLDTIDRDDYDIVLESPDGTQVTIADANAGGGEANYYLVFDDEAGAAYDAGTGDAIPGLVDFDTARTGTPQNPLSAFDGENADGTWILSITDNGNLNNTPFADEQLEDAEIQISPQTPTAMTSIVVPGTLSASTNVVYYEMPVGSGARFLNAGGEPFFAISTIDYNDTTHDWGFTLLPAPQLTTAVVAGWAPGRNPASGVNPTENGSPIYVTAAADTTLAVDYDGDGVFDACSPSFPAGPCASPALALGALESLPIYDPNDQDQNGMVIESETGELITAAWGQDPITASGGAPAIDVGTTVVPVPVLDIVKDVILLVDSNQDGDVDAGDILQYIITVSNVGTTSAQDVVLEDPLDQTFQNYIPGTTQVFGTTVVDGVQLASPPTVPDDTTGTPFPLDAFGDGLPGIGLGAIPTSGERIVTFNVAVLTSTDELQNTAIVTSPNGGGTSSTVVPTEDPSLSLTKTSTICDDPDGPGGSLRPTFPGCTNDDAPFAEPGDFIQYEITLTNTSVSASQLGIVINDAVPDGTSYVAGSTIVNGFGVDLFQAADQFNLSALNGSNGMDPWAGNWVELSDDGAPGSGEVEVIGGELRVEAGASGGDEGAQRAVNLTGFSSATLNFIYRLGPTTETGDVIDVEILDGGGVCASTSLNSPADGPFSAYASVSFSGCALNASNVIRFVEGAGWGGADEFFTIDNVQVLANNSTGVTATNDGTLDTEDFLLFDGTTPNLVLGPDGFGLLAGQSMTVTFEVQVDEPLDPFRPSILNVATARTIANPFPLFASVVDPVREGGAIGDRVWIDIDGDGIDDVGEPGIPNVELTLYDDGGDGPGGGNDTVVGTTTTDTNGNYLFDNLPPGTYFVDVTESDIPTGLSISPGSTDPSSTRTITGAEEFFDADFGYRNATTDTAIIGDLVWSDGNNDGLRQPYEPGIGGVTVDLIDLGPDGIAGTPDDSVDQTTTTAPDGTYLFVAAAPGSYVVQVTDTDNVLDGLSLSVGPQAQSNPSSPITVIADDVYLEADFGYFGVGTTWDIFDSVWIDANNDGLFNATETGIEGVTVSLLDLGDDGVPGGVGANADSIVATSATDANGEFFFSGLPDGNYRLLITDTNNATQNLGPTTAGAANGFLDVTIAGADISNVTFGYNAPGVIGDTVWNDANNNQVRDPGESGFGSVEVNLYRDVDTDGEFEPGGDDGAPIFTTLTDAFGHYQFVGLEPGEYFVAVCTVDVVEPDCSNDGTNELSAGYTLTTPDDDTTAADGAQILSSLSIGESDLTADFGYRNPALFDISGTVFDDEDRDGFREPPDVGIGDVKVVLLDDNGDMIAMTRTNFVGFYEFPDLPNGDYTVEVIPDDSPVLVDYELTSGVDSLPVTISGGNETDNDFGYARDTPTGSIGDTVFNDANRDGVLNGDESGVAGVTVALLDAGPDGIANTADDTLLATDVTDANGGYLFDDLAAGNYFVRVLDADDGNGSGNGDAYGNPGTPLAGFQRTDSSGLGADSAVISLSEGQNFDEADFGYAVDAGPPDVRGSIGDEVWLDADGDGVRDAGEPGISGVRLDLFSAGPNNVIGGGDDVYVGSTVTDQNGLYLFDDLAPGNYYVRVRDAADVTGNPANNGDDVGNVNTPIEDLERSNDAGPQGIGANSALIALGDNQHVTTADFGYEAPAGQAVLGDTVFFDENGNGVQDDGELGIPDILVRVTPNGGGTTLTAITDGSGNYLFTLPTGVAYDVSVCESGDGAPCDSGVNSLPAGLTQTTLGGSNPFTTPALPATGNLDVDFGFDGAAYATIGDSVYRDNGIGVGGVADNGIQDGAEAGIAGVTVHLVNVDSGIRIATTTTDASGNYSFTGLDPNTNYRVELESSTLPPDLYATQEGGDVPASVLTAGGTYNDADFGFNGSGSGETGTIGDRVFLDVDGDGLQDAGEPGIGGVTVQLWTPGPNGIIEDGGGDDVLASAPGLTASQDTGPDGFYRFENVPAGTYYVLVEDTNAGAGIASTPLDGLTRTDTNGPGGATNTDTSAVIYLADGEDFVDADFGYDSVGGGNGLLGDTVYYDANGDGDQDFGEVGLSGIRVIITPFGNTPDCGGGGTSTCVETDGAGSYLESLPAGDYTVVVCTSAGVPEASCDASNSVPSALDPNGTGTATEAPTNPVTVPAGGANLDADFGFDEAGDAFITIGDTVYRDDDGNATQNGAEPGIQGVTLNLVDLGADGAVGGVGADADVIIATTTTDGSGNYTFSGVPVSTAPGGTDAYLVVVTDQNNVLGALSPTQSGGLVPADDVDAPGDDFPNADFGFTTQQELGDTVFVDVIDGAGNLTPDGFQQTNELGIRDVLVVVVPNSLANSPTISCSDATTRCVTTSDQGMWSVLVPSGNYTVFVCTDSPAFPGWGGAIPSDCNAGNSVPAGFEQLTTSFSGSGTRNPQTFNVSTGSSILYADFGFQDSDSSDTTTIGDTVYFDADGDGMQGGSEPGIENVSLELIDTDAGVSVAKAVTDENGNYRFYGVDPTRNYQVVVTDEANLLGILNPTEGGPDGTETVTSGQLSPGVDFDDADFGYEASGGVGAIGNKIWRDLTDPDGNPLNGDGGVEGLFQDGEPGLENVEVQLWRDNNNNGTIDAGIDDLERTTFTDELGNYFFLGLPVGIDYIVSVTDVLGVLSGMNPSECPAGGAPPCAPDGDNITKRTDYLVDNLTTGTPNNFAVDFGYEPDVPPRTLSGLVYFDANNDGNYQAPSGDRGEPEVLVNLFRELPGTRGTGPTYVRFGQQRTTLTDTAGAAHLNYRFTDLPAGLWRVIIDNVGTFLDGANQTEPITSPSLPSATRDGDTTAGDQVEVDFGFFRAPTLVVITDVRSILVNGEVALRFETGSEVGSVGFYAWRLDPETGDYLQVNEEMVPAVNAPQGAIYTLPDPGAEPGAHTYYIYEMEMWGGEQVYGPIHVETEETDGLVGVIERLDSGPIAAAKQPDAEDRRRFAHARAEEKLMTTNPAAVVGSSHALRRSRSVTAQIRVTEGGLQRLESSAIAAATGQNIQVVEAWIGAGNWQLRFGQRAVAWYPSADGTAIMFFAPEPTSKFSPWAAYQLSRGRGLAMPSKSASAGSGPITFVDDVVVGEEDLLASLSGVVDENRDFWFWIGLNGASRGQLELEIPGATGSAALLEVQMYGASDYAGEIDHRLQIWLNPADPNNPTSGEALVDPQTGEFFEFSGFGDHRFQIQVPAGRLIDGTNTLVFDSVETGFGKGVNLVDWIRVHTERAAFASGGSTSFTANAGTSTVGGLPIGEAVEVFELGGTVRRLSGVSVSGDAASFATEVGRRYFVTTAGSSRSPIALPWASLEDDGGGAEYVVIVPAQLRAAADRLADYRSGQYSTAVFEVEGIFNEYAGGDRNPAAIRAFLAHGWANWSTKPRFVTLLGRGTFDYRDLRGFGGNLLPPMLRGTPKGVYSADAVLADVEGDSRPEFAIGRVPSLTNAEANAYIDKLITYEQSPSAPTNANRDVLFLNDDADLGGQFAQHSQRYGLWVTQQPERHYTIGTAPFSDLNVLRGELFARLNDGAYWLNLTGHGGLAFFAAEQAITKADVTANLVEAERLPIVTTFSCSLARFELPNFSSLGEALTLGESRGAIAVFGPSGVTYDPAARIFGERLFEESFGAYAQPTLGEAILEASRRFRAETGADYMIDVYNLLGDAAIQLQRP